MVNVPRAYVVGIIIVFLVSVVVYVSDSGVTGFTVKNECGGKTHYPGDCGAKSGRIQDKLPNTLSTADRGAKSKCEKKCEREKQKSATKFTNTAIECREKGPKYDWKIIDQQFEECKRVACYYYDHKKKELRKHVKFKENSQGIATEATDPGEVENNPLNPSFSYWQCEWEGDYGFDVSCDPVKPKGGGEMYTSHEGALA